MGVPEIVIVAVTLLLIGGLVRRSRNKCARTNRHNNGPKTETASVPPGLSADSGSAGAAPSPDSVRTASSNIWPLFGLTLAVTVGLFLVLMLGTKQAAFEHRPTERSAFSDNGGFATSDGSETALMVTHEDVAGGVFTELPERPLPQSQAELPTWVTVPSDLNQPTFVVTGQFSSSRDDAEQRLLDAAAEELLSRYNMQNAHARTNFHVARSELNRLKLIRLRFPQTEEVNGVSMVRYYGQVEQTTELDERLYGIWRRSAVDRRLLLFGGGFGLLTIMLGATSMFLRTQKEARFRRTKKTLATVAFAGAGVGVALTAGEMSHEFRPRHTPHTPTLSSAAAQVETLGQYETPIPPRVPGDQITTETRFLAESPYSESLTVKKSHSRPATADATSIAAARELDGEDGQDRHGKDGKDGADGKGSTSTPVATSIPEAPAAPSRAEANAPAIPEPARAPSVSSQPPAPSLPTSR